MRKTIPADYVMLLGFVLYVLAYIVRPWIGMDYMWWVTMGFILLFMGILSLPEPHQSPSAGLEADEAAKQEVVDSP